MEMCGLCCDREEKLMEGVVWTCQYNKFLPCGSPDRLDHLQEGVGSVQHRPVWLPALWEMVVLLLLSLCRKLRGTNCTSGCKSVLHTYLTSVIMNIMNIFQLGNGYVSGYYRWLCGWCFGLRADVLRPLLNVFTGASRAGLNSFLNRFICLN